MGATRIKNTIKVPSLSFPNLRPFLSFAVVFSILHIFRIVLLFYYNGNSVQHSRYPHEFMTEDSKESHSWCKSTISYHDDHKSIPHYRDKTVCLGNTSREAIARYKLRVQIHSTDMIFYFLSFSATTSPGTQSSKFTIIVNSKQIDNSG